MLHLSNYHSHIKKSGKKCTIPNWWAFLFGLLFVCCCFMHIQRAQRQITFAHFMFLCASATAYHMLFAQVRKKSDTNSYIVINNDNKSRFHNYCTLCATHSWHICSFAIQPVNVIPLGWGSMHIFTCCSFCRYYFYENAQRFLFTFVQALSYNGVHVCACMALAIKMYVSKRNEMNKKKNCTAAAFFFDTKLQLN